MLAALRALICLALAASVSTQQPKVATTAGQGVAVAEEEQRTLLSKRSAVDEDDDDNNERMLKRGKSKSKVAKFSGKPKSIFGKSKSGKSKSGKSKSHGTGGGSSLAVGAIIAVGVGICICVTLCCVAAVCLYKTMSSDSDEESGSEYSESEAFTNEQ